MTKNHYIDECKHCPHFRHVGTMSFGRDEDDRKTWEDQTSYYCNLHTDISADKCTLYGVTSKVVSLEQEVVSLDREVADLKEEIRGLKTELLDARAE